MSRATVLICGTNFKNPPQLRRTSVAFHALARAIGVAVKHNDLMVHPTMTPTAFLRLTRSSSLDFALHRM